MSFLFSSLASSMAASFTSRDAAASEQIYLQTFPSKALPAIIHIELTSFKKQFPGTLVLASRWSLATSKATIKDLFGESVICPLDCMHNINETFSETFQC